MTFHQDIPEQYRNRVVATEALPFLRTLPDKSVPLYLFSPPYNLGNSDGSWLTGAQHTGHYPVDAPLGKRGGKAGMGKKSGKWDGGALAHGYDDFEDNLPWPEYIEQQHAILRECWRTLTDSGAIYYNHKPRILDGVLLDPILFIPGLPIRQRIIWARAGGMNFNPGYYVPTHEYIYVIAKPLFRLKSKGAAGAGDVWSIPQEGGTWHPAPFPLAFADRVLETSMPPFVCDTFMGRGTTAVAAKRLGIDFIGCDRNASYVAKAQEWIDRTEPMNRTLITADQSEMFV